MRSAKHTQAQNQPNITAPLLVILSVYMESHLPQNLTKCFQEEKLTHDPQAFLPFIMYNKHLVLWYSSGVLSIGVAVLMWDEHTGDR